MTLTKPTAWMRGGCPRKRSQFLSLRNTAEVTFVAFTTKEIRMAQRITEINPGKAGPKGALAEKPKGKPTSGPPGAEGNNTRRDFVGQGKSKKNRASSK